ncbi:aminotransferase class I/II-fold pyridoxal phosphate-dependent enzyme [Lachnoclostridium sp. Marseille-P6806]|uniref:aminotransferase class I/II-fold pyridoxal phosphate-dependent enzyme n=1 Tax=Lachnoclostridium sp. Marseille-P6806 TaxID=2364793 RepID=UPI00102FD9AC|nr:beta-eliminating lyase-related protein [Lachnoclostridium sp. Marseille-P6806]
MSSETAHEMELINALHRQGEASYPFHMPGHKRRAAGLLPEELPYRIDFTEIPGTDNLHEADGILRAAMERTARLCGVPWSRYLVNGSTCGNLAAIAAAVRPGGELIAARNCHRSIWHAAELLDLAVHVAEPPEDAEFHVSGSVNPGEVQRLLVRFPKTEAVVLTSPTYEGVLSDVHAAAELCHERGIPLIVDEAHGAHLGLCFPGGGRSCDYGFPDSASHQGADVVIQSAHKTLPGLTQTAWLHLCSERFLSPAKLEHQLDIFETSSPSYPLLCSLDSCTGFLLREGRGLFERWERALRNFHEEAKKFRRLRVLCCGGDSRERHGFFGFDPSKLYISGRGAGLTGAELAACLRERFHFEMEMTCGDCVLAMTSPMDSPEALAALAAALRRVDDDGGDAVSAYRPGAGFASSCSDGRMSAAVGETVPEITEMELSVLKEAVPGQRFRRFRPALEQPAERVSLSAAQGRQSGEYLWCYPPGVPILLPGEEISEARLSSIRRLAVAGTEFHRAGRAEQMKKKQELQ